MSSLFEPEWSEADIVGALRGIPPDGLRPEVEDALEAYCAQVCLSTSLPPADVLPMMGAHPDVVAEALRLVGVFCSEGDVMRWVTAVGGMP